MTETRYERKAKMSGCICLFCGREDEYLYGSDGTIILLKCPCWSLIPAVYELLISELPE